MSVQLYWRTARHLQPEQLRHQLGLRLRRFWPEISPRAPRRAPGERAGWGPRVQRCRGRLEPEILEGRFRFWGLERQFDLARPWTAPDLPRSWNYPVHYFDAAPSLAQSARDSGDAALAAQVCRLLDRWIEAHPPGREVPWEPYPTALRIVNWLDVIDTLAELAPKDWRVRVLSSLHLQARWLSRHLERHLLGTHLLKDAKALLLAGGVFDGDAAGRWRDTADALLQRELARQIRSDGSHMEPSVMYHDLVLEDVLDLLDFGSAGSPELRAALGRAVGPMLEFAAAVQTPAGEYPLLGDSGLGAAPAPRQLLDYAARLGLPRPEARSGLAWFSGAGLAVWRDARQYVLADVGTVGPPHLPGHGHCDSLSFEWHVDRMPFVVDAGTLSYEAGCERDATRGTGAHNTFQIDAREQHEIWGAFRVARRAAVRSEMLGPRSVVAELVPWHDRRLRCRRRFEFESGGVRILDRVEGPGEHRVESRLHLHPQCTLRLEDRTLHLERGGARARIVLPESPRFEVFEPARSSSVHCEHLGEPSRSWEIVTTHQGSLPFACELQLLPGGGAG